MQMKRAVSRCTARRSNASRRATGRAAPVAYAAHAGTRATHVPHVRVTPAIRGCANRRPPIDAGAHPSKQARRRHRADRRDARGRAIAAGALIDPEPLAVLPRDPGGRAAAPCPCRARVRIAIARLRQRVGFLRPSEARRKQVFLRETVFDDLCATRRARRATRARGRASPAASNHPIGQAIPCMLPLPFPRMIPLPLFDPQSKTMLLC